VSVTKLQKVKTELDFFISGGFRGGGRGSRGAKELPFEANTKAPE